jgi:upstream activation factor subunit UAF30
MPRTEVVKRLWVYIKANNLQDPNDGRQIKCDETLKGILKAEKVTIFSMNKHLSNQLHSPDE